MMNDTPQVYRWKDPALPPNAPALQVYFIEDAQINDAETAKSGIQTFDNVLIAYVSPMGMPKSNAAHEIERRFPDGTVKVSQFYANKYGPQIKAYKEGQESEATGTPLMNLIGMSKATAMNLRARGISTVEMLADMPDGAGAEVMGFWDLRDRAKKFLADREKEAPAIRMQAMEETHQKEVRSLQRQIDEMKTLMSESAEPEKRGPGRPRKAEAEAA